jgi:hypothetical protein
MGPEELEAAQLWSVAGLGLFIGIAAVGSGLKGEPEPCPACAQRGGEECIFCTGTGRREAPIKVSKREFNDDSVLGLTRRNPLECTACKGGGHDPLQNVQRNRLQVRLANVSPWCAV